MHYPLDVAARRARRGGRRGQAVDRRCPASTPRSRSGWSPTSRAIRWPASSHALRCARGRPVVVVAGDMPFVSAELVARSRASAARRGRRWCRAPAGACSRCARATSRGRWARSPAATSPRPLRDVVARARPADRRVARRGAVLQRQRAPRTSCRRPRCSAGADARGAQPPMALIVRTGWTKPGSLTWCLSSLRHTASRTICSSSASSAPVAQRRAQVGLVEREQARAQPAVGGQADAVAVAAERLARPG